MIGGLWNIRGTGKPGRKQAISDWIAKYKLEFIGLQETKKQKFQKTFLDYISGSFDFCWCELSAKNTAGGILVGFRTDMFEVINCVCYKYCVAVSVVNKIDGFVWKLVVVYGTAYYDFKLEFIAELHDIMEASTIPTLIGGYFNLVRSSQEKSNGVVNAN
jgi:hypothetical protein